MNLDRQEQIGYTAIGTRVSDDWETGLDACIPRCLLSWNNGTRAIVHFRNTDVADTSISCNLNDKDTTYSQTTTM